MVLLEGDAGIGKTTLMREAIAAASGAGARVLAARPAAAEAGLAFSGLGDLLADVLEEIVTELPAPQAPAWRSPSCADRPEGASRCAYRFGWGAELPCGRSPNAMRSWWPSMTCSGSIVRRRPRLAFAIRRLGDERVRLVASLRLEHAVGAAGADRVVTAGAAMRLPIGSLDAGALHRGDPVPRRSHAAKAGAAAHPRADRRQPLLRPRDRGSLGQMSRSGDSDAAIPRGADRGPARPPAKACAAPSRAGSVAARSHCERARGALDRAAPSRRTARPCGRRRRDRDSRSTGSGSRIRCWRRRWRAMIGPRRRSQLHAELAQLVEDPEQRARHLALVSSRPSAETADEIERRCAGGGGARCPSSCSRPARDGGGRDARQPTERSLATHHRGSAGVQACGAPGAGQEAARERYSPRCRLVRSVRTPSSGWQSSATTTSKPPIAPSKKPSSKRAGTTSASASFTASERTAVARTSDTPPRVSTPSSRSPPLPEPVRRESSFRR